MKNKFSNIILFLLLIVTSFSLIQTEVNAAPSFTRKSFTLQQLSDSIKTSDVISMYKDITGITENFNATKVVNGTSIVFTMTSATSGKKQETKIDYNSTTGVISYTYPTGGCGANCNLYTFSNTGDLNFVYYMFIEAVWVAAGLGQLLLTITWKIILIHIHLHFK